MIYTVISDIHSNAPALDAFFDFFPESSQLVCLGDVIGYGTSPSYCLDQIRRKMPAMINGNHERWCLNPEGLKYASPAARHSLEWTRMRITDSDKMYLSELPEMMMLEDRFMLAHGSPRDPDEYLFEAEEAMLSIVELKSQGVPLAFVGHTHIPGVFTQRGRWFYQEGRQILLDKSETYIINPGSLGQPRDKDPRASFCVFDSEKMSVTFLRIEYDIRKASDAILENGLPEALAYRLLHGV